jgi:extracellular elastinolytic metalloproteinase
MRLFLTAPLVVASLAGHVYAHRQSVPLPDNDGGVGHRRKSLGFGPTHPTAVFRPSPYHMRFAGPVDSTSDPFDVARVFVEDILASKSHGSSSYVIRKDSYTDKNTGVSHVYVRQVVNGLEVDNGDMNINIQDGMVFSYGDSVRIRFSFFFSGRVTTFTNYISVL